MNLGLMRHAERCIRCGFCLEACPTYKLTGQETLSPRGRIRLITSVMADGLPLSTDIVDSIDLCLGCRACETACPSAVRYGAIVEGFRAHIEDSGVRARMQGGAKRGLIEAMERPAAFAASLSAAAQAHRIAGVPSMPGPVARALSGRADDPALVPITPVHPRVGRLPDFSPAVGERRFTVCVLQGCVMRVMYHHVNLATLRVLQRLGCDVICPPDLACCGALDLHAGLHEAGRARARAFLDALRPYAFDAFVVNSAGCGSTLREYAEVLADDPVWAEAACSFSRRVRDVAEFVWAEALGADASRLETARLDATVTYHDACHLAHGQGITEAPRRLLQAIPGVRILDLSESDMCCGSAGTYNLTQPGMARRLLDRKVANIAATGAEIVAMGNPGCMAWIDTGLRSAGISTRVMHTIEVLDEAFGSIRPAAAEASDHR